MTTFTIFYNQHKDQYVSVYDFNLPTITGIGKKKEWSPVYHGKTTGLLDRVKQCEEFKNHLKEKRITMCKELDEPNFPAHEEKSETILQEDGTIIFLDGATHETLSPEGRQVLQEFIDSL